MYRRALLNEHSSDLPGGLHVPLGAFGIPLLSPGFLLPVSHCVSLPPSLRVLLGGFLMGLAWRTLPPVCTAESQLRWPSRAVEKYCRLVKLSPRFFQGHGPGRCS